jgi:hypothetical protein
MKHFQVYVMYKTDGPRSQTLLGFIQSNEPTKAEIVEALKVQQGVENPTLLYYTIKTLS